MGVWPTKIGKDGRSLRENPETLEHYVEPPTAWFVAKYKNQAAISVYLASICQRA